MKNSIFDLMQVENLTNLKIQYNWQTDKFIFYAAKEWDKDINWLNYNKTFDITTLLSETAVYYNQAEVLALFAKHNLSAYVEEIKKLMRGSKHYLEDFYYWEKEDVRAVSNIFNTKLGRRNLYKGLVIGGIRRHVRQEDEIEMLIDGMNLGRGMSFKNIVAEVPRGGCKITVMQDELNLNNLANLAFLSYVTDKSNNITGPDMLFPIEMTSVVRDNWSYNITGDPRSVLGATGTPTAYGVFYAMQIAAKHLWKNDDLSGKTVAIQGLGVVGYCLAQYLIEAGCHLIVADYDKKPIEDLKNNYPKANIIVEKPENILAVKCNILAPCAVGAVLTDESIKTLNCEMILGSANNQLKATNPTEEIAMAKKVAALNILFQPDWIHNAAGVLAAYEEYTWQDKVDKDKVYQKIERVMAKYSVKTLEGSQKENLTPVEYAYRWASKILFA